MLSPQMQRFAAGHEQLELRALVQQLRHGRRCDRYLLEVVEDQQHGLVPQAFCQLVDERVAARVAQADRAGDRGEQRLAVTGRRQIDEEDAVLELVDRAGGGAKGEARLADAAGARERQQPHRLVRKASRDLLQLRNPPHECGRLLGQVAAAARGCDERREAGRRTG